jgi:hypothetical protein
MRSSLTAPLFLALLATALPASAEFYCCQNPANGRRACGDTLPDVCRGGSFKVIDKAGNLMREVGPPMSAEQKTAKAAEAQLKKEQEEQARELRRKDQALLDTYSGLKDIDLAQEKAENDVKLSIGNADTQIQTIRVRRKKLEDEAEFYKKKTLPAEIAKGLQAADHEIKLQEELRDLKNNDFVSIKAKYDADRKRYIELTGRRPAAAVPASPQRGADSRPR